MNAEGPGLRCCGGKLDVIDSRASSWAIRRRRRCKLCGAKVTTFELIMPPAHRNAVLGFAASLALRDHAASVPTAAGQLSLDAALVGGEPEEAPYG